MTGDEMRLVRDALGLTRAQFGNAVGYRDSNRNTIVQTIRAYENGDREIPPWIATRVRAIDIDGLQEFIQRYAGANDRAEFCRQLSRHLTEAA